MKESGETRKCAQCGKDFRTAYYIESEYAYRRGTKLFCSFKCTREYDKKKAEAALNRRRKRGNNGEATAQGN